MISAKNITKRIVLYAIVGLVCLTVSVVYALKQDMFVASIYMLAAVINIMNVKAAYEMAQRGLSMEDYKDD